MLVIAKIGFQQGSNKLANDQFEFLPNILRQILMRLAYLLRQKLKVGPILAMTRYSLARIADFTKLTVFAE